MSEPEISRLREDLEVIRRAAGVDLPFNRRDIWVMAPAACACGAAIACANWWVPARQAWVAVLPLIAYVGVWLCLARSAHRRRASEPVRWREVRYNLLSFWFVLIFLGFIVLQVVLGMPRVAVAASAVFLPGLTLAWFAVVDRMRRYYFGYAIPVILFGLAIPFLAPTVVRVGAGITLIAIGLLSAAIQEWQLRTQQGATDAH